jgi:DNA-binding transcriptional MerR regulator
MTTYSTAEAAKQLKINRVTLQRYIAKKLVPVPALRRVGGSRFREWTSEDIERVRRAIPKIKNGRRKRKIPKLKRATR